MNNAESGHALLKTIRAVSFDLDDTFWDCDPVIVRAEAVLQRWLEAHHPSVFETHSAESMKAMRAGMFQTHKHLVGDVTLMRKAFLQLLLAEQQNSEHATEQAFDIFYRARSEVVLYDGTHELLKALRPTHKLATITNGNADLELIGLATYFDDMRRATLDNPAKPAADMFHACCKVLGVAASELLHVGDNPHTDVLGGHNAGVRTVWFNRAKESWPDDVAPATFEVRSLPELQQLITSIS